MIIRMNGEELEVEQGATLLQIIKKKRFLTDRIVVEHNNEIISAERFADIVVADSDKIEILSFVGGG